MPDAYVVREMIAAEQLEFADLLRRLTPEEWKQPSLCEGWSVQAAEHPPVHRHPARRAPSPAPPALLFDDIFKKLLLSYKKILLL